MNLEISRIQIIKKIKSSNFQFKLKKLLELKYSSQYFTIVKSIIGDYKLISSVDESLPNDRKNLIKYMLTNKCRGIYKVKNYYYLQVPKNSIDQPTESSGNTNGTTNDSVIEIRDIQVDEMSESMKENLNLLIDNMEASLNEMINEQIDEINDYNYKINPDPFTSEESTSFFNSENKWFEEFKDEYTTEFKNFQLSSQNIINENIQNTDDEEWDSAIKEIESDWAVLLNQFEDEWNELIKKCNDEFNVFISDNVNIWHTGLSENNLSADTNEDKWKFDAPKWFGDPTEDKWSYDHAKWWKWSF